MYSYTTKISIEELQKIIEENKPHHEVPIVIFPYENTKVIPSMTPEHLHNLFEALRNLAKENTP